MIRVYALINLLRVVDGPPDTPPDPTAVGPESLEALEGVYVLDDLYAHLGRPLTKREREDLHRNKELSLDREECEIRLFEIEPNKQVKGWVDKARKNGIAEERERLWNLACYFRYQLLAENEPGALPAKTIAEFAEMILEDIESPARFHMKGNKRGKLIAGSEPTEPSEDANVVPDPPSPADVCIECGGPLDQDGNCHFVDCSKGFAPFVGSDGQPLKLNSREADPALSVCWECRQPLGDNPDLPHGQDWPKTVCLTANCGSKGKHIVVERKPHVNLGKRCPRCTWPLDMRLRGGQTWFTCVNPKCTMKGIEHKAAQDPPKADATACQHCEMPLTSDGKCLTRSCVNHWTQVATPPACECVAQKPEDMTPQTRVADHPVPIQEAITQALVLAHKDEENDHAGSTTGKTP